jgi:hypothetical protein
MRRSRAPFLLALAAAGVVATPGAARADTGGAGEVTGAVILIAGGLADVGFSIYDVVMAARGLAPSRGASIAEAVVATPQAAFYTGFFIVDVDKHDDASWVPTLSLIAPAWTMGLTAHGFLGISNRIQPNALPAVSLLIAGDAAFTAFDLAAAFRGRLTSRPFGILEMVLTTPALAVSIPGAVRSQRDRNAWIGAAGWSGALFLHGVAATIWGRVHEPIPDPPPPPPPSLPEKPPLLVPASLQITPAMITGAVSAGPGIAIRGVLF